MKLFSLLALLFILALSLPYAQANDLSGEKIIDIAPMPGIIVNSAKAPTGDEQMSVSTAVSSSSPLPGSLTNYQGNLSYRSSYQRLPISVAEAQARIEELKTLLLVSPPQVMQEQIYNLCEWLTEMYDAHNKLASAFGRQDETKATAVAERANAQKFNQLKNEAQLLRAKLLIRQNRAPEAVASLVEIVLADAKNATGRAAYQQLKELGFSKDMPEIQTTKQSLELNQSPKQTEVSKVSPISQLVKTGSKDVKTAVIDSAVNKRAAQSGQVGTSHRTIVNVNR